MQLPMETISMDSCMCLVIKESVSATVVDTVTHPAAPHSLIHYTAFSSRHIETLPADR